MEYYEIAGMLGVALTLIVGFGITMYSKIKENTLQNSTPINELNISITELTSEIRAMRKSDEVRDKRLDKHGEEIDDLKEKIADNGRELSNHETRIKCIENKM